jgi:hypothetical protein
MSNCSNLWEHLLQIAGATGADAPDYRSSIENSEIYSIYKDRTCDIDSILQEQME